MSTSLQSLVHSSLGIRSLLKREALNANVIDRDKILVLPNWDSWGKIRVLRDGFDVEAVSNTWALDLDQPFPTPKSNGLATTENEPVRRTNGSEHEASVVDMYEAEVQDSSLDALQLAQNAQDTSKLEVPSVDTQAFLAQQMERLEQQKKADDKAGKDNSFAQGVSEDIISDHIGPVQFNMGGIQVDADDMVQRLKVCVGYFYTQKKAMSNRTFPNRIDKHMDSPPNPLA